MKYLISRLNYLKKNFNVVAVKQSLEDEGATFRDLEVMRKITKKSKLNLNVKIGGCEAKNDIFFCKKIKANSIVAPMVETEYALRKFVQCSGQKKNHLLFVNLETDLSLKNLSKMIKSKSFKYLDGIVIGRSDLAGSLNLTKKDVNSKLIFNKVYKTFSVLRKNIKKKLILKMGGSITALSKNFIKKLYQEKLLDNIETRNVEIKLSEKSIEKLDLAIPAIFSFEVDWLKYKLTLSENQKNIILRKDYLKRIKEVEKRLIK